MVNFLRKPEKLFHVKNNHRKASFQQKYQKMNIWVFNFHNFDFVKKFSRIFHKKSGIQKIVKIREIVSQPNALFWKTLTSFEGAYFAHPFLWWKISLKMVANFLRFFVSLGEAESLHQTKDFTCFRPKGSQRFLSDDKKKVWKLLEMIQCMMQCYQRD